MELAVKAGAPGGEREGAEKEGVPAGLAPKTLLNVSAAADPVPAANPVPAVKGVPASFADLEEGWPEAKGLVDSWVPAWLAAKGLLEGSRPGCPPAGWGDDLLPLLNTEATG